MTTIPTPERGISMSGPMINAYLAGRKSQTRRIMGVAPHPAVVDYIIDSEGRAAARAQSEAVLRQYVSTFPHERVKCPHGKPGDELYFREHWRTLAGADELPPSLLHENLAPIWYEASQSWNRSVDVEEELGKFRQGRFMCRWMSRFRHIPILDIRVERLRDISEQDAIDEGIERHFSKEYPDNVWWKLYGTEDIAHASPIESFKSLWTSIYGAESWDASPYVWVISFPKHKP